MTSLCVAPELQVAPGLPEMLLWKSATLVGFFLLHYAPLYRKHLQRLVSSWQSGKLHVSMDAQQFRSDPKACQVWAPQWIAYVRCIYETKSLLKMRVDVARCICTDGAKV